MNSRNVFANPLSYYCWLRNKQRYSPAAAYRSTLMRYCKTGEEMYARLRRRAGVPDKEEKA